MNKCPLVLFLFIFLQAASLALAEESSLVNYFGETSLPGEQVNPPAIVEGELGSLRELSFSVENPDEPIGSATILEVPLPQRGFSELTIALYLKPERREANEALISCKWGSSPKGFRLCKSWMKWLIDVGDGVTDQIVIPQNREADLAMDSWQHIAITFKEGDLRFYKDGQLIHSEVIPITHIAPSEAKYLRVGGGMGHFPSVSEGYVGRMGGIYVSPIALDEEGIHRLMQQGNP